MIIRTLFSVLLVGFSLATTADTIEASFNKLTNDSWLVWEIAIEPDSGWHCWGHRYSNPANTSTNTLRLYWQKDAFNIATNNCNVELEQPTKVLTDVNEQQSIQFINKQLTEDWSNSDKDEMLHALALHRDKKAFTALKAYFEQTDNIKQRELINLFMASYWQQQGYDFISRQLKPGLSFEEEKALIFALSQSPVDAAKTLVYERAREAKSREVRKEAIFWYSQFNSTGIADQLVALLHTEKDQGLQEHIVFAIAQVKDGDGLDELMQLIRTNPNDHIRQQALFWLAHSDEERAMPILEELLVGTEQ